MFGARSTGWAVCLAFMSITALLIAQIQMFVPSNDISFAISPERNSYTVQDRIGVQYRIVNVSDRSLYVPREFGTTACLDWPRAVGHVQAGFVNTAGRHFRQGYGVSCDGTPGIHPLTAQERINKVAVLLHPGEHFDGRLELDPAGFHLPPGEYRIEAMLYGWRYNEFSDRERIDLRKLDVPLLGGEAHAFTRIELLPAKT